MPLCCYLQKIVDISGLAFIVNRGTSLIRTKVPNREFYWSIEYEFYSRLGSWNGRSVWFADRFVKKLMLLRKIKSFLEKKNSFAEGFFIKQVEIQ